MYFSRSWTLEAHDSCLSLHGDTNFYHLVITCAFSTVWILFLVPISPFATNKQFVEDTLRLCKCPIPYQTYCPPPIGRAVYKRIHWWILLESIFTIQLQNGDFSTVIFLSTCIIIRASPLLVYCYQNRLYSLFNSMSYNPLLSLFIVMLKNHPSFSQ